MIDFPNLRPSHRKLSRHMRRFLDHLERTGGAQYVHARDIPPRLRVVCESNGIHVGRRRPRAGQQ